MDIPKKGRLYYAFSMLQIIGTKDSAEYRRTVRYLRERRIPFQEVNTKEYRLSKRELDSILSHGNPIDTSSAYYKKNGYEWREYSPREEIEEHQELLINPILRNGGKVAFGFDEEFLEGCRV